MRLVHTLPRPFCRISNNPFVRLQFLQTLVPDQPSPHIHHSILQAFSGILRPLNPFRDPFQLQIPTPLPLIRTLPRPLAINYQLLRRGRNLKIK